MRGRALICCLLLAGCASRDSRTHLLSLPEYPTRKFATTKWDTLRVIGTGDDSDSTLLTPDGILLWGNRIAVSDWRSQNVRVFSADGKLLWSFAKEGDGPGELRMVSGIAIDPAGQLIVIDGSRNNKILRFDTAGNYIGEKIFSKGEYTSPEFIGYLNGTAVFGQNSVSRAFVVADASTLTAVRNIPIQWPAGVNDDDNIRFVLASQNGDDTKIVAAYLFGPGFFVLSGPNASRIESHVFVDSIPVALKGNPKYRAARADSARYGAKAGAVVGDTVYFLTGGRPLRMAHPKEEPSLTIDAYLLNGTYLYSYLLPMPVENFATTDGVTFTLLIEDEEGVPRIVVMKPRLAKS